MSPGNLTESEMSVVYEARAQSRLEANELERLSQRLRVAQALDENAGVNEFHRRLLEMADLKRPLGYLNGLGQKGTIFKNGADHEDLSVVHVHSNS